MKGSLLSKILPELHPQTCTPYHPAQWEEQDPADPEHRLKKTKPPNREVKKGEKTCLSREPERQGVGAGCSPKQHSPLVVVLT